jgi:hypothetical protein
MSNEKKEPKITVDLSQFEGTYSIDDSKKVVNTLKDGIGVIATIGNAGLGSAMARAMANPDVSKEVILIGGHAGKTVLHHKPDGSIVLLNPTVPMPEPTALPVFKHPFPTAEQSVIASLKSGKQLRNERRAKDRKENKNKKKK